MRRRTSGTCRNLQSTALQRISSSRDGFRTQHDTLHILQRRGPGLKHIEIQCLAIQQWIREKRLSVGRVERKTILQISSRNTWMDRERFHLQGNLDFESKKARMTTESFLNKCVQSSRGASTLSFSGGHNVHHVDLELCKQTSFFFFSFFRQTPQLDFRARTSGSKQALSPGISLVSLQKQVQSYCHLVFLHGSGASSLKLEIYGAEKVSSL